MLVESSKRNFIKFHKLIEELIWDENYSEINGLFDRYSKIIFKIDNSEIDASHEIKISVRETIRLVFQTPSYIKVLSKYRPHLGIRFLGEVKDSFIRDEFFQLFMSMLLKNRASIFYAELARNYNYSRAMRFNIPSSNRLLFYLFHDVKNAQELCAYNPVANYFERKLDSFALNPNADPYNMPSEMDQQALNTLSLSACLHFFEIMVTEALYQGIEWHMWLFYYPGFFEKIIRNYNLDNPLVDPTSEWPTRYSFLMYKIVTGLRTWILEIQEIPSGQKNIKLERCDLSHENGNIPKSSILALGNCVYELVYADKIGVQFQQYLLEIIFRIYFDLRENSFDDYAKVLLESIMNGGFRYKKDDVDYRNKLINFYINLKMEFSIKHGGNLASEVESSLRNGI